MELAIWKHQWPDKPGLWWTYREKLGTAIEYWTQEAIEDFRSDPPPLYWYHPSIPPAPAARRRRRKRGE